MCNKKKQMKSYLETELLYKMDSEKVEKKQSLL